MKILHRYVLGEVLLYGGLGLLLFTFVIFMRDVGRLLELTVGANSAGVLLVFLYALPTALIFTIPIALLVGLLIGLGRLGVDQELIAMRAAGVGGARIAAPLLPLIVAVTGFALLMTLWGAPAAARQVRVFENRYLNAEVYTAVQPRVFIENLPGLVIYIGDTLAGGRRWRQVFVANVRNPVDPQLTTAESGELVATDPDRGALQLHLERGYTYQVTSARPDTSLISSFETTDLPLSAPNAAAEPLSLSELSTSALAQRARYAADWRLARVERQRRWALALACLALALVGLPLGLAGGRGGKSGGFVLTLMLVFTYYLIFIFGLGMARQGKLPPALGAWAANVIFFALAAWLWTHVDRIPRRAGSMLDPVALWRAARARHARPRPAEASGGWSGTWMPSLIDGYIMREFIGYAGLLLASFIVLVLVYTLFELVGDILRTHASATLVLSYLMYLAPQILYLMIPVAILVAVLISFGLMSKANEITALKASGVSVYRLILPVLFVAIALGAAQFALDATWLPGFNRKQDALRAEIKGQPAQTYQSPERKWIFGSNDEIYYYRFFDPGRRTFADISVFRLDPKTFQITRRIFARNARWDDAIHSWVFDDGWEQQTSGGQMNHYERFLVAGFADLRDSPAYFASESRQGTQMSYWELRHYIAGLQRSGYDVARLSVQLARKLAYPLITVVMALLAFPFALSVGRRGAVAGIAVAIAIAITYWVCDGLLEALGNLNQLPPLLAAWTPDLIFIAASVYLLLRVPT